MTTGVLTAIITAMLLFLVGGVIATATTDQGGALDGLENAGGFALRVALLAWCVAFTLWAGFALFDRRPRLGRVQGWLWMSSMFVSGIAPLILIFEALEDDSDWSTLGVTLLTMETIGLVIFLIYLVRVLEYADRPLKHPWLWTLDAAIGVALGAGNTALWGIYIGVLIANIRGK